MTRRSAFSREAWPDEAQRRSCLSYRCVCASGRCAASPGGAIVLLLLLLLRFDVEVVVVVVRRRRRSVTRCGVPLTIPEKSAKSGVDLIAALRPPKRTLSSELGW